MKIKEARERGIKKVRYKNTLIFPYWYFDLTDDIQKDYLCEKETGEEFNKICNKIIS